MKKAICENGGCLSKLGGNDLASMLKNAQMMSGEVCSSNRVNDAFDDCAIVKVGCEQLLLTTDLNHPVGHDPHLAGRIAALHAISDVYAMGGTPLFAIAQMVLDKDNPTDNGEQYMAGLYSACYEERVTIVGGHTIISDKPIIGLSVIGVPTNNGVTYGKTGCVDGDAIWISKPIGTAMVMRAYFNGLLAEADYQEAIEIMTMSNRIALSLGDVDIHALTDVTGFGLLGHLSEMLKDGQGACIHTEAVPFLSGVKELPYLQVRTHFISENIAYLKKRRRMMAVLDSSQKLALFDPQTNGALLAVAPDSSSAVLQKHGFICIGRVVEGGEGSEIYIS